VPPAEGMLLSAGAETGVCWFGDMIEAARVEDAVLEVKADSFTSMPERAKSPALTHCLAGLTRRRRRDKSVPIYKTASHSLSLCPNLSVSSLTPSLDLVVAGEIGIIRIVPRQRGRRQTEFCPRPNAIRSFECVGRSGVINGQILGQRYLHRATLTYSTFPTSPPVHPRFFLSFSFSLSLSPGNNVIHCASVAFAEWKEEEDRASTKKSREQRRRRERVSLSVSTTRVAT
jgi:hypothetical protein